MYDDPWFDPADPEDIAAAEPSRFLSGCGCLFPIVATILIASMVGSSILAHIVITRGEHRADSTEVNSAPLIAATEATAEPATVVAAAAALPTAEPSTNVFVPEINRIAIVNSDGQIETMSPSGEDRRALTLPSDNMLFELPTWTPDGERLAVIGNRMSGSGIYVLEDVPRQGSLIDHQVYFSALEPPIYLYWSPDNLKMGVLTNHARGVLGLNIIAGDGTSDRRLVATGAPLYWDWSGDGRRLLVHAGREQAGNTLALIDLDDLPQAEKLADPGEFQAPGIGQGGRYWAFAEETEGGLSSLVVLNTQTGQRTGQDGVDSLALGWSPARDEIAFTNGAFNDHPFWGPLHVLDVVTGEERILTTQTVLAFFWSPDGRKIAFVTLDDLDYDDSINAARPEKSRRTSRMARLPVAQPGHWLLTLSVVDVETGQGLRLLDFEPTQLYLSQFLPFFDQYALSHRIWSPDSSAIILPVSENGRNVILIVPTQGGRPHRLAEGEIGFWSRN